MGAKRAVWDHSVGEGGAFVQAGKSRCDNIIKFCVTNY